MKATCLSGFAKLQISNWPLSLSTFLYFPPSLFSFFMFLMLKSPLFQSHSPIFCSAGWCQCVTSPSNPSTVSYHHPSLSFSPAICCPWFPCFPSFLLCTAAVFLLLSHRLCLGRVVSPPRVATGWWLWPAGVGSAVGTQGKQAECSCAQPASRARLFSGNYWYCSV